MNHLPTFCRDAEIETIGRGLFDRTLSKADWTHAAHFAAAIWVIKCRPDLEASVELPSRIRALNEVNGIPNTDSAGYHETITQASIRAARALIAARSRASLCELCNDVMASPFGKSDWLFTYWSRLSLMSTTARKAWVEPDIRPLPFP